MRNQTHKIKSITAIVEKDMLIAHGGSTLTMSGQAIDTLLVSKGIIVSKSSISRIKRNIESKLQGDHLESYQKLQSYLDIMAQKNYGSSWRFEKTAKHEFKRACFLPSLGAHVLRMSKSIIGLDGVHLKGEMNKYGVYLVATSKDYAHHIVPFALALVEVENFENWCWFLEFIREAIGDCSTYTIVSDRQKGLLRAVDCVFPNAGHRFCLRHIVDNIKRGDMALTDEEKSYVYNMARSSCEMDFNYYRSELMETRPKAIEYLDKIDKKNWVKYRYQEVYNLPTYNETTSNMAQESNQWIGNELRSSMPLEAFCLYFRKLNLLAADKRQKALVLARKQDEQSPMPRVTKMLNTLLKESQKCHVVGCTQEIYEVTYFGGHHLSGMIQSYHIVNLDQAECTCWDWGTTNFHVYTQ